MRNRVLLEIDHIHLGLIRAVAIYNGHDQIENIVLERRGQDAMGAVRWDETMRLSWAPTNEDRTKLYLFAVLAHLAEKPKQETT
jgi:hypothetical protein